ncbi:MAG: hypothetical protein P8J51_05880 [Dehalococcoidia bacterium]|jgi:hypothetical protein|nr:hypothetical protein [Dehalococcoidia bacterium]
MNIKIIDLVGIELSKQMKQAHELINNPIVNASILIKTEHETIMKFIVPLAAQAGMNCSFAPPKDEIWEITINTRSKSK